MKTTPPVATSIGGTRATFAAAPAAPAALTALTALTVEPPGAPTTARRLDLDWLRIAAFGLLIAYHVGMLYVPWSFHVKSAYPAGRWLLGPMLLVNPWRLSLLFVVSGAATGYMAQRLTRGGLARQRSRRLLLPLAFGMLVVVVPQAWFEVMAKGRETGGFLHFWSRYLQMDQGLGTTVPTWNHLWFVAYLWVYTLLAAAFAPGIGKPVDNRPRRPVSGPVLAAWLLLPWAWLWLLRVLLFPIYGSNHAMVHDFYDHALYSSMFAFGLLLAQRPALWDVIDRLRWPALCLVLVGCATFLPRSLGFGGPFWLARIGREALAWGAILALLGFARRYLNRDHRWRAYLVDVIFAWYIVHQTALIALAAWLGPLRLGGAREAALVVAGTVVACVVVGDVARRVRWLRPWFGYRALPAAAQARSISRPSPPRP
jgi:Acyltransferase family